MNFKIALHSDIGISKDTNQDSMCIKQARTNKGNILCAIVCDGMGGLQKGEVASSNIIKVLSNWFEKELPILLQKDNTINNVRLRLEEIIKEQNKKISDYAIKNNIRLGSTLTMLLVFEDNRYIICHVGDSRVYRIKDTKIEIITLDQTVVAKDVRCGRLTKEQAQIDPRRNILLQCIGASNIVIPDFIEGNVERGECYLLCTDGFRHVITNDEIKRLCIPSNNNDENTMKNNLIKLIELNKQRGETDNISAILIKMM